MKAGRLLFGVAGLGLLIGVGFLKGLPFGPSRDEPSQYASFYGSGSSTLDEEIMPFAGFFGAGSSKLDEPPLVSSFSNARPSAGFLSMSSPIQEGFYEPDRPDRYIPWEQRG
jgi:hypothetical protein